MMMIASSHRLCYFSSWRRRRLAYIAAPYNHGAQQQPFYNATTADTQKPESFLNNSKKKDPQNNTGNARGLMLEKKKVRASFYFLVGSGWTL